MEALLRQEDLDQDGLITVDDDGPKVKSGHFDERADSADRGFCSLLFRRHCNPALVKKS